MTDATGSELSFDELVVHAVAQIPESSSLDELSVRPEGPALLTAEAYGVLDRLPRRAGHTAGSATRNAMTLAALIHELRAGRNEPAPMSGELASLAEERVLVLSKSATHYRVPLFNEVNRRLESVGAAFKAVFLAEDADERWWMDRGNATFQHGFLVPRRLLRTRGGALAARGFDEQVRGFSPTLLLGGGFGPVLSGGPSRYAVRRGIPFGIWSGEISSRPTAHHRVRSLQRRRLLARASFAVAYGSRAAGYLRKMRPELPIVVGRNTAPIPDRSMTFQGKGKTRLLTVSRAVRGKGLDVLIDAMRLLPQDVELLVVGEGSELEQLRIRAAADSRIRFTGGMPSNSVRSAYEKADVFLFPSQFDVFGLVLVEAMAAGLSCIVSRAPGAVDDLCVADWNAVIVDRYDALSWAEAITHVIANPKRAQAMGTAAAETIRHRWTLNHAAEAMIAGFRLGQLTRTQGSA